LPQWPSPWPIARATGFEVPAPSQKKDRIHPFEPAAVLADSTLKLKNQGKFEIRNAVGK
jgi:hypothetical protein